LKESDLKALALTKIKEEASVSETFSFYSDLDSLRWSDLKMPPKFKHKMLHPYKRGEMEVIEATVSLCAQYKGVPIGPALIQYQHRDEEWLSFKGVGVFNQHGQLHNTAFSCLKKGSGWGRLYTNMQEGRPAHHSHCS
jgi:hypothetical protein